jgi:beta-mannosidase
VWHGIAAAANRDISFDAMAKMFAVGVDLDVDSPEGQAKARSMSADQYLADASRFPSEFGLRSMPARPTLAHWIDEEHLVVGDPQITARNRDRLGPTNKIELAASTVAGRVASLDDLIDFSQLTQAEGLKLGCEHFRRRWPSCAGALIWQLDDCWPAPTWSLIDHAGRGKGALAYAKRFYAPVATSFARDNQGAVSLWVVNDTAETVDDVLTVRLSRLAGADAWSEEVAIAAPPASSTCVASWVAVDVEAGADCALLVASASGRIPNNRLFFVPPKDLQRGEPKVNATFAETDGRVAVTVETDAYALFVHVIADDPAVRFDDNYFDLEAGDTRTVTSLGKTSIDELSVRWL